MFELRVLLRGEVHEHATSVGDRLLALHFSFKLLGLQLLGQADQFLDVVLRDVVADDLELRPSDLLKPRPADRRGLELPADLDQIVRFSTPEAALFHDLLKQARVSIQQLPQRSSKLKELVFHV
jgi:hypothetical protein